MKERERGGKSEKGGKKKREREREKGMSEAPVGTPIVKVTGEYRGPGKEIVSQTDRKLPQDATVTTVTHYSGSRVSLIFKGHYGTFLASRICV